MGVFCKKILVLGITLLMLCAFSGVLINKHYCCGELKSTVINKELKLCCVKKVKKEVLGFTKKCCKSQTDYCKIKDLSINEVTKIGDVFDVEESILYGVYRSSIVSFLDIAVSHIYLSLPLSRRFYNVNINILFQRFLI